MKTITIGFSRSKKKFPIGSLLIRWYMGTNYSHVYMKFKSDSLQRDLIYEAVGSGVRFIGVEAWSKHAEEVASFNIEISDEQYIKVMQYCVDKAGNDYGFMQNIGIPLARLLRLNSNPFQTGDNCSEESYGVLKICGITIDKKKDLILPSDIYKALEKGK